MKRGQDISAEFPGIYIVHQKIPGGKAETHDHLEHELFIPLQGEIKIRLESRDLVCGPGRMIYLPPKTSHAFESSSAGQGERIIAIINEKYWKRERAASFRPEVIAANQLFKELIFYLLLHPKTKNAASILAVLIQTCAEALEMGSGSVDLGSDHLEGKTQDGRLKKALMQIQDQSKDTFSMEEVAKRSGLSVRTMNRLFLEELGLTPKQALTQYRITQATRLLQAGESTVTDVAFEVGYSSLSQFITTFRKVTGKLPSDIMRGIR